MSCRLTAAVIAPKRHIVNALANFDYIAVVAEGDMYAPFDVERPGSGTYGDGLATRGLISIRVASVYHVLPVDMFTLKDFSLERKVAA